MSRNVYIIIVILVLVVLVGYYIARGQSNTSNNQPTSQGTVNPLAPESTSETPTPDTTSNQTTGTVTYTDSGFTPSGLTVKVGTTVTFKNTSSSDMWVASNPHPTHTDLPGLDAKKNIAPGDSYTFTFTKVGSWGYHNHLNPAQGGIVTVQ